MTKEIVRDSFIFQRHWWDFIKEIDNKDDRLFIFEFIFSYVFDKKILEFRPHLKTVCKVLLHQIDFSLKDAETSVYVVRLSNCNEAFYKIGISKNIQTRIDSYSRFNYHFLLIEEFTRKFPTRQMAIDFEKDCHKSLLNYSYTPTIDFTGKTECFGLESIECIKNFFKEN